MSELQTGCRNRYQGVALHCQRVPRHFPSHLGLFHYHHHRAWQPLGSEPLRKMGREFSPLGCVQHPTRPNYVIVVVVLVVYPFRCRHRRRCRRHQTILHHFPSLLLLGVEAPWHCHSNHRGGCRRCPRRRSRDRPGHPPPNHSSCACVRGGYVCLGKE